MTDFGLMLGLFALAFALAFVIILAAEKISVAVRYYADLMKH